MESPAPDTGALSDSGALGNPESLADALARTAGERQLLGGEAIGLNDFLALLDYWQTGSSC